MTPFLRIKNYVINLQNLAWVTVGSDSIDFAFARFDRGDDGPGHLRFQKGTDLQDSEFEEVKDFVFQLPDPDRVIVV